MPAATSMHGASQATGSTAAAKVLFSLSSSSSTSVLSTSSDLAKCQSSCTFSSNGRECLKQAEICLKELREAMAALLCYNNQQSSMPDFTAPTIPTVAAAQCVLAWACLEFSDLIQLITAGGEDGEMIQSVKEVTSDTAVQADSSAHRRSVDCYWKKLQVELLKESEQLFRNCCGSIDCEDRPLALLPQSRGKRSCFEGSQIKFHLQGMMRQKAQLGLATLLYRQHRLAEAIDLARSVSGRPCDVQKHSHEEEEGKNGSATAISQHSHHDVVHPSTLEGSMLLVHALVAYSPTIDSKTFKEAQDLVSDLIKVR
jgi:hypothetical protein